MRVSKQTISAVLTILLIAPWVTLKVQAETTKPTPPIKLAIQEPLANTNTNCVGQVVHIVSLDTTCQKGNCLLKGTQLQGRVDQIKKSKRFLRPGLINLKIEKVTLPSGQKVLFEPNLQMDIRHGEVMTVGKFNRKVAFDLVPEIGLDYTLGRTTNLSSLVQNTVSLAPDFVVDYTLETLYPTVPNESKVKRVIFALLDATYIPFFISVFRKDSDLIISSGDVIQITPHSQSFQILLLEHLGNITIQNSKNRSFVRIESELINNPAATARRGCQPSATTPEPMPAPVCVH